MELEDEVQNDLKRATGEISKESEGIRKLNRVLQLTGFSDPVYAEAYVTVHQVCRFICWFAPNNFGVGKRCF